MNKEYLKQRISIFSGMDIDPDNDNQVKEILQRKFNILLPQRARFTDALTDAIGDHEIISLLIKYRVMADNEIKKS